MSADPVHDSDVDGDVRCWCCGARGAPSRMVRLGDHPEVHLCPGCAHFVHQQACRIEDEVDPGPVALVRDRLRTLRALVIRRGWHHNRVIGGTLRWLGRYLP